MTSTVASALHAERVAKPVPRIDAIRAAAYTIPTDRPEPDGTLGSSPDHHRRVLLPAARAADASTFVATRPQARRSPWREQLPTS